MSCWDVVELGRRATVQAAADVLDRLAERMPFPVWATSIDNGSEFTAEFEAACAARGIALFVLPHRSPTRIAEASLVTDRHDVVMSRLHTGRRLGAP